MCDYSFQKQTFACQYFRKLLKRFLQQISQNLTFVLWYCIKTSHRDNIFWKFIGNSCEINIDQSQIQLNNFNSQLFSIPFFQYAERNETSSIRHCPKHYERCFYSFFFFFYLQQINVRSNVRSQHDSYINVSVFSICSYPIKLRHMLSKKRTMSMSTFVFQAS